MAQQDLRPVHPARPTAPLRALGGSALDEEVGPIGRGFPFSAEFVERALAE